MHESYNTSAPSIEALLGISDYAMLESKQEEGYRPFKRLLVGIDLSDQSEKVARIAAYLSSTFSARMLVAIVVNIPTGLAGNESDGSPANENERHTLDSIRLLLHRTMGEEAEKVDVKVLHGDPAERLSEFAEYSDSDLVILGSRNRSALRKAILGSVSGSVAGRSRKPVLIIK